MKKLLTEIEFKVNDIMSVINDAFVQHEKDIMDILSRVKYPDDVSNLFFSSGNPDGRLVTI